MREAIAEGKFDGLPFQGEPLPIEDERFAGEWAMAFCMLRNAGAAPPWIAADKEFRTLLATRDAIVLRAASTSAFGRRRDRAELERLVTEINGAVARLNAEAPTDRQHRTPLHLADELARYDVAGRG